MVIKTVHAREILDSRSQPTLEVSMTSDRGHEVIFSVPCGKSTGEYEAVELRDGDKNRYRGMGVLKAVAATDEIAPKLIGKLVGNQSDFDKALIKLDGTENKHRLGANTILALSGAYYRLSALEAGVPLWQQISKTLDSKPAFPRIFANVVNGGKHAPGLDVQEFIISPKETLPSRSVPAAVQIYQNLGDALAKKYGPASHLVGDEGGYAPVGATHDEIWTLLRKFAGTEADLAADAAATSFETKGGYKFEGKQIAREKLFQIYLDWAEEYDLLSIEDPFGEEDLEGFEALAVKKPSFFVIGDDVTVTSAERINALASHKLIGGVIIKPNQIGTVTETLQAIQAANKHSLKVVVSHRSGETSDDFIVDLAYGAGAYAIKVGSPNRGERVAKYNRLLAIEEEIS
jgi:enolase